MYLQRSRAKCRLAFLARGLLALCVVSSRTIASNQTSATSSQATQSPPLSFVRAFSSADDVRPEHPVLDRTLNIIAGPADPEVRVDALKVDMQNQLLPGMSRRTPAIGSSSPIPAPILCTFSTLFTRNMIAWIDMATVFTPLYRSLSTVKITSTSSTKAVEACSSTTPMENSIVVSESCEEENRTSKIHPGSQSISLRDAPTSAIGKAT